MNTYWRKFAFSAMLTSMLSVLAIGLLFGGAHSSYGAAPTAPAGQAGNWNSDTDTQGGSTVTTGSDAAHTKLSSALRGATGKVWVTIFHHASAGAALRKIEPSLHQRAYTMKDGSTLSIGQVDAAKLVKLASVDGVERIADYTDGKPDVITPEGPVKARGTATLQARGALWEQQRANGAKLTPPQNRQSSSPNAPEDWYDISDDGHRASQAWENGYDGTGVRVAVIDTGVDFGHPDLAGMYAVYPSGVYSGWPYAWSDKSVAYWNILHEASTPENYDWSSAGLNTFVDTSRTLVAPEGVTTTAVITIPVADYSNGGSFTITHTYTMPTNSQSGVVHVGFHPDPAATWLNAPEYSQPALVVVDANTAGVYDTVYVDYDNDHNFNNDEAFSKSNTTASYDVDGDGVADFSGGLLYWIADGTNPPAGSYIWTNSPIVPGAGDLVAFMFDTDPFVSSHGTLCASGVVAQGVVTGDQISGTPVAPWKPGGAATGNVYGTANDARVAPMITYQLASDDVDSNLYAALGPDGEPGTGDEVHVTSNSYGYSGEDADGFDVVSRQFAQINLHINPNMTILGSAGNGAAGYGTNNPPGSASTVINVGASTLYGSTTTFDTITGTSQINWGDTQSWSGRAPSSIGRGTKVLANGAWGGGDVPINVAFTGNMAWESWGGTSRSTPVAAGVVALIYDAFMQENGRYPTFEEARHLLMAGANENGYDIYSQGAGVVDAVRSTDAAAGNAGGAIVPSPSYLMPGSFDGVKYGESQSFINLMTPGSSSSDVISLTNTSAFTRTVNITTTMLQLAGTQIYHQHTISNTESPYASPQFGVGNRPDYIVHEFAPDEIPADTSYMVVQEVYPFENFNPQLNYNNAATNNFRLAVYRWTDINGDTNLWTDTNGNGAVNEGEIDPYEYMRFNYGYNQHTTQQTSVGYPMYKINNCDSGGKSPSGCPQERIFIGILHRNRSALTPETDITVKVSFYRKVPFDWLSLSDTTVTMLPFSTVGVDVTTNVPAGTGVGMYEGAIWLQDPSDGPVTGPQVHLDTPGDYTTQVPVSIAVAADSSTFNFAGQGRQDTPYDNNVVWGYNDWSWRAEAGDWRFYNTNVPASEAPAGSFWLVHTSWDNYYVPTNTIPTDLDTYLQGPTPSGVSNVDPANFGPYRLSQVGGSSRQHLGSGVWRFQTATGGTEEWVSGRLSPGLNQIQVRTTVFNGRQVDEPFNGESGRVSVNPYPVGSTDCDGQGTVTVNISSTISIPSVETFAAGLSQPVTTTEEISLNELKYYTFTLTNPAVLEVRTREGGSNPAPDVDIRVQKNVDGNWITIGASEGGTSTELIRITLPGAGEYRVRVHGFAVANSPGTFLLTFNNIDGTGLQVVSAPTSLAAGQSATIELAYNQDLAPGTYNGAVFVGPEGAVGAVFLPVTITITGDCPEPPACEIAFQDVPESTAESSFYPYVECLACRNIIGGYPCGDINPVSGLPEPCGDSGDAYYRPDNDITRGQIAKIVAQSAGYDTVPGPQIYADVPPEQVFWLYIQQLSQDGVMGGYECGGVNPQTGEDEECDGDMRPYFRVNNYASRGQLSKIVANAAGVSYSGSTRTYQDVPVSSSPDSFYPYIEGLTAMGVMGGYECGTTHPRSGPCIAPNNRPYFRPELNVTRGQAAKIVANTFFPDCQNLEAKP